MYLSKLELVGFKSFPKKTVLRFDEGVTAIVGPNGCGKSNIIDAIRWVIGEQRASALRSDKMENVIFNGTGFRKPLGMAEVSLTIQNTKGILPTEYSEVTISRRLFRNGDSEYLLNKVQCRLKDIVELFMDTGMGANAYSVIELKMIETILSDKSGDRRQLFEEAAGVTRYKQRRKEALRKLDQTQSDLERVHDIVREISKKVTSLERQAGKAEEYKKLESERLELDIELIERDYVSTLDRIIPLEAELNNAKTARSRMDEQLAREELTLRALEQEQAEIEIHLAEANRDLADISNRIAAVEQERAVSIERQKALRLNLDRAHRQIDEARGALKALEQDREDVETSRAEIREQIVEAKYSYEELEGKVSVQSDELQQKKQKVRGSQEEVVGVLNRIGELRAEEERLTTRMEMLQEQLDRYASEDESVREELERATEILEEVGIELTTAEEQLETSRNEFQTGESRKNELRQNIDQLNRTASDLRDEINARRSKVEFLGSLVDQNDSVRYLVGNAEWGDLERQTVADLISTKPEHAPAIAAALGDAAGYLVVPTFDDAVRGMSILESERQGVATFVCLDRLGDFHSEPHRVAIPGAVGRASDLATCDPRFDALRHFLLDDTIVVESADQANDVVASTQYQQAVTLTGGVFRSGGVVRGGASASEEIPTLGRREKILELEAEIEERSGRLTVLRESIAELQNEHDAINLSILSDRVRQAQQKLGTIEKRKAQAEYEREYGLDLLSEHAEAGESSQGELSRLGAARDAIAPRREALLKEQVDLEAEAQRLGRELEEFEFAFAEQTSELNNRKIRLIELQSEERTATSELERIRRDHESAEGTIRRSDEEIRNAHENLEHLDSAVDEHAGRIEEFRKEMEEARKRHDEVSQDQTKKREEIARHAETIREERKGYEHSVELAHELEMKIGELRTKAASLVERGREELELELVRKEFDQESLRPIGELRERLRQVRSQIKMLGNVNLLAYEEWEKESERLSFLQQQVGDLQRAESDLVSTIAEINDTAQRQFTETFEKIRANFRDLFQSLFHEGDEADLVIEEGAEDILEARIEIVAKPRGKRPHSIDLLSGGEKTLTAISLLFAIYLVKPSPFCILDEVDAPLDDANIERFVKLIRKFDNDTQFIIVTHNKKTMAAADTVFGVTQQEDGISEILRHTYLKKSEDPENERITTESRTNEAPVVNGEG